MRLPLLPPASLSAEQKALDMVGVIEKKFGELLAHRKDGAADRPLQRMAALSTVRQTCLGP